ncbi:MAG: NADH:ubiquinone reductase (Na(+)-transporting) subunit B, partial [Gammaproteobacteria bacterium]|nr:NADH:ubiquinone reductase (Na(+)-transporting) subunit B [Gammaproteobacteria bacterium]
MGLRRFFDKMEPHFTKGGRFEKYYSLYEMVDTIFYMPEIVTRTTAHVRDALDMKRVMILVWAAALIPLTVGIFNLGLQANTAIAAGAMATEGWREDLILLFAGHNPASQWDNFWFGFWYFIPIYIVTF